MKKVLILSMCFVFLFHGVGYAEETTNLAQAYVTRGDVSVAFSYPEDLDVEAEDGSMGTIVSVNHDEYVAFVLNKKGISGVDKLRENAGADVDLIFLSEDIAIWAEQHGHLFSTRTGMDIVSIGLNLSTPEGQGLCVTVMTPCGKTAVYDLLLQTLGSMTNCSLIEQWLTDEWIPLVAQQ